MAKYAVFVCFLSLINKQKFGGNSMLSTEKMLYMKVLFYMEFCANNLRSKKGSPIRIRSYRSTWYNSISVLTLFSIL